MKSEINNMIRLKGRCTTKDHIWGGVIKILLHAVLISVFAPVHADTACKLSPALYSQSVPDGAAVTLYEAPSVPKGSTCDSIAVTATCRASVLVGAAKERYASCMVLEEFTGLNFNRDPQKLDTRMLSETGTTYVRSFIDVLKLKEKFDERSAGGNTTPVLDPSSWQTMKDATDDKKAKMILSLQWDFRTTGSHPPLPGSEEEALLFSFLDRQILDPMAESLTIIVSGNEPFVDTDQSDWLTQSDIGGQPLVIFYARVTKHIDDYLKSQSLRSEVKLFVGAFTQLQFKNMQNNKSVRRLMRFANMAPYVDGIDIHLHVKAMEDMVTALSFGRKFTSKPILVSEYTAVFGARSALAKRLPLGDMFGQKWGLPSTMAEIDYLSCHVFRIGKNCSSLPITAPAEWKDFLATRSWYIDDFLLKSDAVFRRFSVLGATFGALQKVPSSTDLEPTGTPWFLGFVYSPASIGYRENGMPNSNYQYLDDLRQLTKASQM